MNSSFIGNSFKIKFISRLSRYSTQKSPLMKGNQTYRGSIFAKRVSHNESMERYTSGAYRYKSIKIRRDTP